jgi:hypothetical protein
MRLKAFPARAKRGSLALIGAALVVCGVTATGPAPLAAQEVRPGQIAPPFGHRATPPAGFSLQPDSILGRKGNFWQYVRGLVFDTSARGADRRVLMQGRDTRDSTLFVGPKAELAPEVGATLVRGNWAGQGRVMARITLWSRSPYPHLHLRPGVTYVVVQSMKGHPDSLLAFFVATGYDTTVAAIDTMNVRVLRRGGPARFILSSRDDDMCWPCNHTWCCPTERT